MNQTIASQHQKTSIAVILVNLGTPDAPTPKAVARYLREFLSDPRVVDAPRIIWWFVLNCIIVPFRSSRVAKLYEEIWCEGESPMRAILKNQVSALQKSLEIQHQQHTVHVIDAMTYGNPSMEKAFDEIEQRGIQKVLIVPMYPQYSTTTTEAVYDKVARVMKKRQQAVEIRYIKQYCDDTDYLDALAHSIQRDWNERGQLPERLLFSFHGIPQKYADRGDPYPDQCRFTARETAKRLNLNEQQWLCTFQSRFGPAQWVQPYTDETLRDIAQQGVQRVDVVCPAFSADCLETLEEIATQNRDVFLEAGGVEYRYIPALNADDTFIDSLSKLVIKHLSGWL